MKITIEQIIQFIDLTDLNTNATTDSIIALINQANDAKNNFAEVASLCVYPQFIDVVKNNSKFKVTTVVNFPRGDKSLDAVYQEIDYAIEHVVDEIDIVIPYFLLLDKQYQAVESFIQKVTTYILRHQLVSHQVIIKFILETGELADRQLIQDATKMVLSSGAHFVKTSTGKVAVNATLDAVDAMLTVLSQHPEHVIGLKVAGGCATFKDAIQYLELVIKYMGEQFLTTDRFRFGASSLLHNLTKDNNISDNNNY